MYIIVGLGNPSPEYAGTRHNVGFEVVTILADRFDIPTDFIKHKAVCGRGMIEGNKVIIAKPQTFMNLSGESVRELVSYYKIDVASELIVVYDDVDLPPGKIRIRKAGSAGGHNGMKNIISHIGTEEFIRIRVGVGEKPKGYDLADYVLGHFKADEKDVMDTAFIDAANAVVAILNDGIDAAMNRFNRTKKEDDESD
ncbi:MAG: aminoacyl-tRNA hydrolase [Lachnospiraceae bacterium]|nr:aminoacyl-tRNA hydrolase [Lachnospiraceae bacterium]